MKLMEDNFIATFDSVPEVSMEDQLLSVLEKMAVPEEQREEAKEAFHLLVKIMRAKEAKELEEITIEDVLLCFRYINIFEEYFGDTKAGNYFSVIDKNMAVIKTARKRRIL